MLSGHREVLPQTVQQRETLGGEAGPPERRGWYAPSSDCTVFRGNYCIITRGWIPLSIAARNANAARTGITGISRRRRNGSLPDRRTAAMRPTITASNQTGTTTMSREGRARSGTNIERSAVAWTRPPCRSAHHRFDARSCRWAKRPAIRIYTTTVLDFLSRGDACQSGSILPGI